jgi:hypothetical protein
MESKTYFTHQDIDQSSSTGGSHIMVKWNEWGYGCDLFQSTILSFIQMDWGKLSWKPKARLMVFQPRF